MRTTAGRPLHWLLLACLLVAVTAAAFIWSTRSLGYPNPAELRSPVAQISRNATRDRDLALTRSLLLCLDSLAKSRKSAAIAFCTTAVELDPRNGTALKLRGNAWSQAGRYERAIEDFSRAIALAPGDAEAYRFRANAYAVSNKDRLAIADYNRAIDLSPSDPFNFQLRGYYFQMKANYRQAISDFSVAISMQPRLAAAWNSRCWARAVAGIDLMRALSDCDQAITLQPGNANAWDSRGLVLLKLQRNREAVESYSKALAYNARLASSLFGRGVAKQRLGDYTASRDLAAARAIERGIEARFVGFGIRLHVNGSPGT